MMCNRDSVKRPILVASMFLFCLGVWYSSSSSAGGATSLLDQALDNVSAMDISVGGNLSNTCTTNASSSICIGTYSWTDSHANDNSVNKGAIVYDGYVQQNLVSNINVSSAESPTATGANVVGTINAPQPGITISLSNNNNANGFLGGF
jgi:hypothetical protein